MSAVAHDGAAAELESAYRRLLRALPPRLRQQLGEEMLGVYLDAAPDDRRAPRFVDRLDVLRLSARGWSRELFLPRQGDRTATLAALTTVLPALLTLGLGRALISAPTALVADGRRYSPFGTELLTSAGHLFALIHDDWVSWALWAAAIPLILAGRLRLARIPAVAGTLVLTAEWLRLLLSNYESAAALNLGWLVIQWAATAVLIAAHRRGAVPSARWRRWAAVAAVVTATWTTVQLNASSLGLPGSLLYGVNTEVTWAALATAVLVASRPGRLALPYLAVLAVPVWGPRALLTETVNWGGGLPSVSDLPFEQMALCAVLVVLVVPLGRIALDGIATTARRLAASRRRTV